MISKLKQPKVVYKYAADRHGVRVIVTLRLPKGTLVNEDRVKCRASRAVVLRISKTDGSNSRCRSARPYLYDDGTRYRLGQVVKPDRFDTTTRVCSNGIHYYRTFDRAANPL